MPGRVSGRSARSSTATVGRKSSTATLKSTRGSASARTSAYAVEVPDEGPSTSLRTQICQVFADAQRTTATQRKLVVTLRKIQEACCYEPQNPKKKQTEDFDEEAFNEEVGRCVVRILAVKKSEPVGDRIIRFLGIFLKRAADEDKAAIEVDDDATAVPETPTSRLTTHILSILLQVLTAKDKTVRFRATQSIAHIVNSLDSIDDEMFHLIRLALQKRLRDKEPSVRVQAVLGLGPLAGNGDEESDEEDSDDDAAGGILFKLLDIMQNDPSADVRRTVLMNLPFQPITIKYLLERARDIDPATRRALYGKLLPVLGDFRHMSLVEREKLIRWGLRDRDEGVRKAAANLFRERWIEDCAKTASTATEEELKPGEAAAPNMEALLELLERIDVTHSGVEEGIAHQAMKEFWEGRPDYIKHITFDDDFWNDLTPESAFVVRSLNDYSIQADDDRVSGIVEEKMPEVTKIAFFIQQNLNRLIEGRNRIAQLGDDVTADIEEAYEAQEFIVEQLLHIAATLDYTDEVGRRQIFTIMREALSFAELPEECTKLAVEVLRTVCGSRESGEKEFCSVVLEAVAEVRDTLLPDDATEKGEDADESFHSAQSDISDLSNVGAKPKSHKTNIDDLDPAATEEKRVQEVYVYAKCLHIAECMLQNIHNELEANSALVTMLNTLIVPACRSHEAWIREMGLKCLGLCALLSKDLATNNFELFLHCFAQGHDSLQMIAIQVLTDVIITHPSLLAPVPADPETTTSSDTAPTPNPLLKPVTKTFLKAFNSPAAELSQTACTAASKLLLLSILPQNSAADILKTFTLAYFNPETAANPALRQALSYFLPVFCHSRQKNAVLMSQIVISVLQKLMLMRDDLDEEAEDMVSWAVVAGHLSEWTDGRRVVGATELGLDGKMNTLEGAEEPHILLAIDLLERALKDNCTKEEKKPLLTLLSKLHIASAPASKNESVDEDTLRTLHALATEAVEAKLGPDATTRNYISKLEIALTKRLGDVEHVTQLPADDETVTPDATELPTAVAPTEAEMEEEDEDTMMANPQAEGTRMPLEDDDDEEDDTTSMTVGRDDGPRAITESDIVDSLLESEI